MLCVELIYQSSTSLGEESVLSSKLLALPCTKTVYFVSDMISITLSIYQGVSEMSLQTSLGYCSMSKKKPKEVLMNAHSVFTQLPKQWPKIADKSSESP